MYNGGSQNSVIFVRKKWLRQKRGFRKPANILYHDNGGHMAEFM